MLRAMNNAQGPVCLADFVQTKRLELGLSEIELSKLSGTSQGIVNKVCNGKQPVPLDRIEAWMQALQLNGWEDKRLFVQLCHHEKLRHKRDLQGIHQDLLDALAQSQADVAHLESLLARCLTLLVDVCKKTTSSDIQHGLEQTIEILDDEVMQRSTTMQPLDDLAKATPWKNSQVGIQPGICLGRGDIFPRSLETRGPIEAMYRVQILDSEARLAWDDLLLAIGQPKLEQQVRRLAGRLIKRGLPQGWYVIWVKRWAHGIPTGSVPWLLDSSSGKLITSPG